jgi:hypothetical protein
MKRTQLCDAMFSALDIKTSTNLDLVDFTYNVNINRFNFIEHFVFSATVFESFIDFCSVRHDGDNLSDDDAVTLSVDIDWSSTDISSWLHFRKFSWHKAYILDLTSYKRHLKATLDALYKPLDAITSHNVIGENASYFTALNDYSNAAIYVCIDAVNNTIPFITRSNADCQMHATPGWSEHVASRRDKSIFWHDIWVECGRSRYDTVTSIMRPLRRNRTSYHYAVRFVKNNRSDLINNLSATAILANNDRDFWREANAAVNMNCNALSMVCC